MIWGIKSMSKCRYLDIQISPSYNTKWICLRWTMCPRWRACTVYHLYHQCTSVPVQCARAEARVVTVDSDQVRPRVYLVLISRPAQPPSVHQPLVTTPQPAPVSEQPASGQHRHCNLWLALALTPSCCQIFMHWLLFCDAELNTPYWRLSPWWDCDGIGRLGLDV